MAEIEWEANPKRPSLRRAIRHRLPTLDRPFRVIAEDFLAAETRIDLLGVGDEGELVSLRIGDAGEDAELLTRLQSDLVWLRARTEDLLKLVPSLCIRPSAEARGILLCPEFQIDTRAAIQVLAAGPITLLRYRCYRLRGQLNVTFEPTPPRIASTTASAPTTDPTADPTESLGDDSGRARPVRGFRTGLNDAELSAL